jgi:hypothetical protein
MAAINQYVKFQPQSQPGFLQGENSQNFGAACGYLKDIFIEIVIAGIKARFINVCPDDALAYHGREVSLPQYVNVTNDQYRAQLLNIWNLYQFSGTTYAIKTVLGYAGFNHVFIFENHNFGSDQKTGSTASGNKWFQFWVVIDDTEDHLFLNVQNWGGGVWSDPSSVTSWWGFKTTPANWRSIKNIVTQWKPAHTILKEIIVVTSGSLWGISTWGGTTWWAEATTVIIP